MFFRFLTYNKFKEKHWSKLSYDERLTVFQKLENIQAKKLHRLPCEIVPKDLGKDIAGYFESKNKRIYINQDYLLEDNLRFFGMVTLFHEGRHAFQYKCCFEKDYNDSIFSPARKWRKNFLGYVNGDEDITSFYTMQPVERDATKYALYRLKQFRNRFKESFVFQKTLEFMERDFMEAKLNAKKELGFFYNLKIAQKTKRNHEKK